MIRGLLDVTDTIVAGAVVHPPDVRIHDGDDPYLVVAADKGTAALSDTANAIAAEYGFWLGDAFASGGSTGYDHKALGITARGAWESVRRHFRELGHDVERSRSPSSASATCRATSSATGCCARTQIRLIGAFDHRNVFLDPEPGPARLVRGAAAPVRSRRGRVVGRLRPERALDRRRRLLAQRQGDRADSRGARRARRDGRDR